MKISMLIAMLIATTNVLAGAREAANLGNFNYSFQALPLQGRIEEGTKAWSGDYWAFKYGNINLRWNTARPIGYNLPSPNFARLRNMSEAEIAKLAPSEKWSLYTGDYQYDFVREVGSFTGPNKKLWAGICHGWAPASIHHEEPTPKTLVNRDGIRIPFGSGDIKGILSYFYAEAQESAGQLGRKCGIGRRLNPGCGADINPAALHVVMANMLGLQKEGFIIDRDPGKEVWNQPVSQFRSVVSGLRRTNRGYNVDVATTLTYTDESAPTWNVVYGTPNQKSATLDLRYTLELDHNKNIVDGSWNSNTDYPDFAWITPKLRNYTGKWAGLERLLND